MAKIKTEIKEKTNVKVRYAEGVTISKSYQSWRVDAEVTLPCANTPADIDKTFEKAKEIVANQLKESAAASGGYLDKLAQAMGK